MNNSQQKEALKWRLRLIFLYYASYADRNNYKLLKSQNYRRFLIDSEAVTDQAGFPPFDIAFRKIHSSSIKLEQFQELLPVIAQLVYQNKNRKEAFTMFISKHIEKLYDQILVHSEFGADVTSINKLKIQKRSIELLSTNAIQKTYQKYIETTSMHQKQPQQTFQRVHCFLSDFQISPKLIYKAMVYLVFFQLLTLNNNASWGIQDLQKLLICLAELYWRRAEELPAPQETKVVRLLQHMETSVGFKKMVDKTLKENAVFISFFQFPQNVITQLKQSRQKEKADSLQKRQPYSTRSLQGSRLFSSKKQRKMDMSPIADLLSEQGELVKRLRQIFQKLCSYGQVGNNQTLKSIKIKKYFKSLNILSTLEQTWLDITITDLCRSSLSGKIQFTQFLQLLQQSAQKLSVSWEGLFHYLTDHSMSQLYTSRAEKSSRVQKRQQIHPRTIQILLHIQKTLEKIYIHYKGSKKRLSFEQLSHLFFDFQIFPAFVTKAKLYNFFQNRSKAQSELKKLAGEISLGMEGFLYVMIDIANEIGDNLNEEQKMLFILERMQDSQGHRTLLGSQGTNLIGDLRSRYALIYKKNLQRESPSKQEGFQELLQNYHG